MDMDESLSGSISGSKQFWVDHRIEFHQTQGPRLGGNTNQDTSKLPSNVKRLLTDYSSPTACRGANNRARKPGSVYGHQWVMMKAMSPTVPHQRSLRSMDPITWFELSDLFHDGQPVRDSRYPRLRRLDLRKSPASSRGKSDQTTARFGFAAGL